jgi:membrane fusion protein (multidrug efflux system)
LLGDWENGEMSTGYFMARAFKINWPATREVVWRAGILMVALAIILIITTRWNRWVGAEGWQSTDDAYLQADLTPISAKVSGYVRDVPTQDFQRVHAGQLVALIVDDDYRAAVAQAQANVAAAVAQIDSLKAERALQDSNVEAARSVVDAAMAALGQNDRDVMRQRQLLATGSSSTEEGEKLRTIHAQLSAQLGQNRAQADAAIREIAVLAAKETQAAATLAAKMAALRAAEINLAYTRILAPQDGVLGQRQVHPGQLVEIGSQITTLTPLPHVWVIANYKETQLTHMAIGDRAEIRVDTFPGEVLHGHVLAFAPGSGAEFALLPPDNATGNFTKVVQRIAVKITIDDGGELAGRLRPGMSVVADVDAVNGERP